MNPHIKQCGVCHKEHQGIPLGNFVGVQQNEQKQPVFVLFNCECGSTLSWPIQRETK